MVALSAAIVSSGKMLLARQFVEMSRLRVESLISTFQELVDSGKDHTFIEADTVRFVYQPMDALHLVLVTNKSSNIFEDLQTLRLLAKVVKDCCQLPVNEERCVKNALDIVFAFDEVVSFGHRESVTLSQIKSYTEMDSREEEMFRLLQQSKEHEAHEAAKRKEKEIRGRCHEMENNSQACQSKSIRSDSYTNAQLGVPDSTKKSSAELTSSRLIQMKEGASNDDATCTVPTAAPAKSLVLSKKNAGDVISDLMGLEKIKQPAALVEEEVRASPLVAATPLLKPVKVDIEEKVEASCEIEGGLSGETSCTGQLQVTVLDASKADLVCFKLAPQSSEFTYKVHPNLNKKSHANNILEVRDATKAFRVNALAPLLKWHMKSNDDTFLPVSLSCWPTSTADGTQIVMEFELTDDSVCLEDVVIRFPAPGAARPTVVVASPGHAAFDAGSNQIVWHIPVIDKNENLGTLEFAAAADQSSLLPATFEAVRRGRTLCPLDILGCYHQETKDVIGFECEKNCTYMLTIG